MKRVIPGKIKTQLRLDGYYNVLNKYGTQHDSTEYYQWATGAAVTDAELADLYAGNGLFSTIIDAPADDATKNGIDLGVKDKDLQKRLDDHLQTIHYQSRLAKALKWARLFGGSAVVMLVDDGRLLQDPLNWRDVHGVEELLVYGRNEVFPLWINGYENNPADEDYRKGGTGIPEYMRIREELRNACIGPGYSIRLLERLSMVTYKMKNLANVLSTVDGDDTVLQRMEMLDLARNLLNMVFIDADGEDVGIQSLSVAGVKDILDNACAMLSAVSHIPQTRLFGRSPAGENATGEGDMENYKEAVSGIQSGDLRDNTRTLVELILRGMAWNGEIDKVPEYTITYKSAWSLSDDEKATQDQANAAAQLARAQTASAYVTAGILETDEVRRSLAQDEQFDPENIITEADVNQDWGLGGANVPQPTNPQNPPAAGNLVTDEGDCGYVAGFVLNDGKILCGQRSDGQGWCGPGGHIEPGETPSVAFRREAKEEFNIDVGDITYLGNCKGKPDEVLPVQIYLVNGFDGVPRCDQKEMFTATWMPPEQILKQDVPGGLVFEPFLRSVKEYLEQLGITLDDFDESKHNRDENGKFSSSGGSTSLKDVSSEENPSKDLNDSQSHAKINSNAVSAKGANTFKVKGFPNKQKLNNHWQNGRTHAAEYAPDGITTKEQYEKRAVQLLESPCGNGIKGYKTKDGLVCRYDAKKNDFAKGSPEKGVRTMFKPDDGEDYYKRQLELEGIEDD